MSRGQGILIRGKKREVKTIKIMISVIYILKGKIYGAKVNEKKLVVSDSIELGWDANTFDISLAQIIEKLRTKKIRILLDDSYSYVLRVSVPADLNETEERSYVSEKIKEQIPEVLRNEDWDYKEIQFSVSQNDKALSAKEKEVIVFSPVKYLTELISEAVQNLRIDVEAIEPVEIASTRNSNPIIGIALKNDIEGDDKKVLNISLVKRDTERDFKDVLSSEKNLIEKPKDEILDNQTESITDGVRSKTKSRVLTVLLLLVIVVFLSVLGFFIYRDFFSKRQEGSRSEAVPVPSPVFEPSLAPTPFDEDVSIDFTQYKILVKNGSGVGGEAQSAVELLKEAGFTEFETGNADSYNYRDTEVLASIETPESVIEEVTNSLSVSYNVASGSSILENSEYDIEIIVGAKK